MLDNSSPIGAKSVSSAENHRFKAAEPRDGIFFRLNG